MNKLRQLRRFPRVKALVTFLATAALACAAEPAAPTLVVGSSVTTEALTSSEWIQGEAPKAWEPGKVYILECWATWCGPCVAAIPHVNELSKKYADKGLRVCGMNVWERTGKQPVVDFVKAKGEGMSYPVSYNEKDGLFDKQWLTPAGVNGIPHAFVVKDGKIILMSHPMQLTDAVIDAFLAGGDAQEKAIAGIALAKENQAKTGKVMQAFSQASAKKDIEGMTTQIEAMKALDPESPYLESLGLQLLAAKGDWAGVETAVGKMEESPNQGMVLFTIARMVAEDEKAPASLMKAVLVKFAPMLEQGGNPVQLQMLAGFQVRAGDKDAALASAKKAVEAAGSDDAKKMHLTPVPFQRYAEALEKGSAPTSKEFQGWLRESMSGTASTATGK